MLPEDQIEQIKKQLIEQINSTFPEDKKQNAIQQIKAMNAKQLEEFLIQNNLIKQSGQIPQTEKSQTPQCVFCSITSGQTPTHKIDENKDSIATLEINPISKAHTLIIPKKHIEKSESLPASIFTLAKKVAKKIKTKFNPKDVSIFSSNLFGHQILNVLPIYENETQDSERKPAKPEELEELKKHLAKKPKPEKTKQKIKKIQKSDSDKLWLPRRIP